MFLIIYLSIIVINFLFYFIFSFISEVYMLFNNFEASFYLTDLIGNLSGSYAEIGGNNSGTANSTTTNGNTYITSSDGSIMISGIIAVRRSQLAKQLPTTVGKVSATVGGILIGGTAIVIKNILSNISSYLRSAGKSQFISSVDNIEIIKSFFNLSVNNGLDLLNLIQICNAINITIILSMFYILFCLLTDKNRIRQIIFKIIQLILENYYMSVVKISLIVILLLLNLFSN